MTIIRYMRKLVIFVAALGLLLGTTSCLRSARSYLDKGDKLYASGKYEEAVLNYKNALQKDQNSGEAYYGLALTLAQQGKARDAYEEMNRAAQLLSNRQDVQIRLADLGLVLYLGDATRPSGLYKQLTEISDALLAKNSSSFDGLRIKGYLRLSEKKTPEALDFFGRANAIQPPQAEVGLQLTQILIQSKAYDEAERVAWRVIQSGTSLPQIYDVLYTFYLRNSRLADAERVLKAKVDNNPKTARYITQLAAHYYAFHQPAAMNGTLQRLRDFPDGHLLIGDFLSDTGQLDEARREFEAGAKSNPKQAAVYQKRIADLLLAQGKKDEAMRVVDSLVSADPSDMSPRSVKAGLLMQSAGGGKIDAAVKELTEVVKNKPNNTLARYNLARALLAQGNLPLASGQFQEAIRQQPRFLAPRYHLAEIGVETRRFDLALRYANDILAIRPGDPRGTLLLAMGQQGLGKLKESRDTLNAVIRQQPGFIDAQLQLGLLDMREKRLDEAREIFRKLYQPGDKDTRPLKALVEALMAAGQYEQALQILTDALKRVPDSADIHSTMASSALKAHKTDLAIDHYQWLVSADPNNAEFLVYLGEACYMKGDTNRAVATLQKAHQLDPQNPQALAGLAPIFEETGKTQEAMATYRQLLQLQPENPAALNNLALLMSNSGGNLDEALRFAEKAQQKMPNAPPVADTVGWIYLQKGMPQSAVRVFSNLTLAEPGNATYHYHYGLSLLKTGNKQKGAAELRAALMNHPSKDQEAQIRQLMAEAR
jgi:tetratricopeptide (TPR) repeat protein